MKNITISVKEDTARWARIEAAKRDVSVSRMISEMLEAQRRRAGEYEEAAGYLLSVKPNPWADPENPFPPGILSMSADVFVIT